MIGNGEILTQHARIAVVTPADVGISTSFQVFNKTNFPTLIFDKDLGDVIDFDEMTGIFTMLNSGYLTMNATLNFSADQASANLLMIPEFDLNGGAGWTVGVPRKKALTAIRSDQVSWTGEIAVIKGARIRFCFAEESGNISLCTETLDPGGPLEVTLPAAIFYIALQREYSRYMGVGS